MTQPHPRPIDVFHDEMMDRAAAQHAEQVRQETERTTAIRANALREAADWYTRQGKVILAAAQVAADLRRMADAEPVVPSADRPARSDVGSEFVRQADQPDETGLAAWEADLRATRPAAARATAVRALAVVEAALGDTLTPDARETALTGLTALLAAPATGCTCGGPHTSTTLPSGTTYEEHRRHCALMQDDEPADRAGLRETIAEALADATGSRWPAQAFLTEADAVLAVLPSAPTLTDTAVRAAALREAADQYTELADQSEAYDREHGQLDETARLQHETVRDVATGLRRLADEAQPTTPETQDTCRSIEVAGQTISVRGSGVPAEDDLAFFGEVVSAAKRRYAAEHPDEAQPEPAPVHLGGHTTRVCRHCWTSIRWADGQWTHTDGVRGHAPEPPPLPAGPAAGEQQDGAQDRG